jgi:hypothetical protein
MSDVPRRGWQALASNWRIWLWIVGALLVATIAWLLGYD